MPSCQTGDVTIEYETHGSETSPAFVMIRGLSTQLIQWPDVFLDAFVTAGFRVVVLDNRDAGLSEKFDGGHTPEQTDSVYRLGDMAMDVVGVLDALDVKEAHIAGISLGGMIAQHLAFSHGARCLSVASVMSTSGAPGLPPPTSEALEALVSRVDDPSDREAVIAHNMRTQRVIESPNYPPTETELRSYFERAYDRCYTPNGPARQMAAVAADGSRVDRLRTVTVPFLVVHGSDDPLIPIGCGEATASVVPGAKFEAVAGMGHDVTEANSGLLAGLLIDHARSV